MNTTTYPGRDAGHALTPQEWDLICSEVERLWPGTKTWAKADQVFDLFSDYDDLTIRRAVARIFDEGHQTAPSPSAVKGRTREVAAEGGVNPANLHLPHRHNMGEITPSMRYGGWYADSRGPGEVSCSDPDCDYRHDCHCDGCRKDPLYALQERPLTHDEMMEHRELVQAAQQPLRGRR